MVGVRMWEPAARHLEFFGEGTYKNTTLVVKTITV